MRLWLRLEGTPGDSIEEVAGATVEAAKRLQLGIHVDANGVDLTATGNEKPEDLVKAYHRTLEYRRKPLDEKGGRGT